MAEKKKILAVASIGGHWVQLLRICKGLEVTNELTYMSTNDKCATMVEGKPFYRMGDFSRWDWYKMFPSFFHSLKVIRKVNPDAVITTGAAPGLIVLLAAFCLGKRTVWVDSIANVSHLSLCGRVARKLATRCYTQWEDLKDKGVYYAGNVIN